MLPETMIFNQPHTTNEQLPHSLPLTHKHAQPPFAFPDLATAVTECRQTEADSDVTISVTDSHIGDCLQDYMWLTRDPSHM